MIFPVKLYNTQDVEDFQIYLLVKFHHFIISNLRVIIFII